MRQGETTCLVRRPGFDGRLPGAWIHGWTTTASAVSDSGVDGQLVNHSSSGTLTATTASAPAGRAVASWVAGTLVVSESLKNIVSRENVALLHPVAVVPVLFLSGLAGALLGRKMLQKHFVRAGIA